MFDDQTKEAILKRMLDRVPDDIDKRVGSVTYDMLSPASIELALAYIQLGLVLQFGFAGPDQPREYLILRAAEMGITPKPAIKSKGSLTFRGPSGTVIAKGTEASTNAAQPVYFVTTEAATIGPGGSVTVAAEAKTAGANGNVPVGAVTLVLGNLSGIVTVTNEVEFTGGVDEESTESLLARYYEKVQKPATSGNVYHYMQWAKEVPGISDARVIPLWNGPLTVKVIVLGDNKRKPSPEIIAACASHIEAERPIGAEVTVVGANETPINVAAKLTLNPGYTIAQAQTEITAGLTNYLASLAFKDPIVRYSQIANLILDSKAVLDYANLTVNGDVGNVEIADDSVAVVGTVTLT